MLILIAQRVQCVSEACWRTIFEYACDHGDPEAYIPLATQRMYLKLHEDKLRTESIYVFEDEKPPEYTRMDEDLPPAYNDLYGSLERTVGKERVKAGAKRKRSCSAAAAVPKATRVLRSASRRNAQI